MKLAFIGVGQAGGKIVDAFLEYDKQTRSHIVRSAVAINTAKTDLVGLDHVPKDNRLLVGQSRVKGHGVGADNELDNDAWRKTDETIEGGYDTINDENVRRFGVLFGAGEISPGDSLR